MKRRGTGRRRKSRHVPVRFFIMTGVIIIICMLLACHVMRDIIGPNMEETARIKAAAIVSRTVNRSLAEELEKQKKKETCSPNRETAKANLKWSRRIP